MGSRYLFICLYVWLEKFFSRGDYAKPASVAAQDPERLTEVAKKRSNQDWSLNWKTEDRKTELENFWVFRTLSWGRTSNCAAK
jgi:hypothetical protein